MTNDSQNSDTNNPDNTKPQMTVLAQYLTDLSFENPNPLIMLQQEQRPSVNVDVNTKAQRINNEQFETKLHINVKATKPESDDIAFLIECTYNGIFLIRNIPGDQLEAFLLIECARFLFPYARNIVSDATRDGGFPPLFLDPIDFFSLYRQKLAARSNAVQPESSETL
jgi:preprotein translocase subunit SecB